MKEIQAKLVEMLSIPIHVSLFSKPSYRLIKPSYRLIKPSYRLIKPSYRLIKPSYRLIKPSYRLIKPMRCILLSLFKQESTSKLLDVSQFKFIAGTRGLANETKE
jgi:hypothetical protein